MFNLPIEVIGLVGYLSVVAVPHVAIAAWEGWTGNRFDSEEWGGIVIFSFLWPLVLPVAVLLVAVAVAGRVIRAASKLARSILGGPAQ